MYSEEHSTPSNMLNFGVGLGFRVEGLGFRGSGGELRVLEVCSLPRLVAFRASSLGIRVQNKEYKVWRRSPGGKVKLSQGKLHPMTIKRGCAG